MEYREEEFLMLSGIQHFAFCRRQWALIHIEQQWAENVRTMEGLLLHEKADSGQRERRKDVIVTRSLPVYSRRLGMRGRCDVVEWVRDNENGARIFGQKDRYRPVPVEYKRGRAKADESDALQLCAQAICLEEMLCCEIAYGQLFYHAVKRREEIRFDPMLRDTVAEYLEEMHALFRRKHTPKAREKKGCRACSLREICLPSLAKKRSAAEYVRSALRQGQEPMETVRGGEA